MSTPIGNLEDVTLRALRVLAEVDLIAAEDTRRTAKLLGHYAIRTRTISFHEHNEARQGARLLQRLTGGDAVALVADAGTPLVSDPGARLVREALAGGVKVHAVPGPSAAITGLIMSGFGGTAFTVAGFPPARSKDRKQWLERLAPEPRPLVVFESPHRIRATLADMAAVFGDRGAAVCREMTKVHEELVNGLITEVAERLGTPRGEYTIVVGPPGGVGDTGGPVEEDRIRQEFCHLTDNLGCGRRLAVRILADRYAASSRSVYALIEDRKKEWT